jgi:uncharacterized protein (TIGR03067 family)
MFTGRALTLLAVSLLLTIEPLKNDEPQADSKALQGMWTLVSLENNGEAMPENTLKGRKLFFKGDEATFTQSDQVYSHSKIMLDSSKKPKQIDITQTEGREKGKVTKGIYRLEMDKITFCYIYPGEGRPTEFKSEKNAGCILLVYQRDKR